VFENEIEQPPQLAMARMLFVAWVSGIIA